MRIADAMLDSCFDVLLCFGLQILTVMHCLQEKGAGKYVKKEKKLTNLGIGSLLSDTLFPVPGEMCW